LILNIAIQVEVMTSQIRVMMSSIYIFRLILFYLALTKLKNRGTFS